MLICEAIFKMTWLSYDLIGRILVYSGLIYVGYYTIYVLIRLLTSILIHVYLYGFSQYTKEYYTLKTRFIICIKFMYHLSYHLKYVINDYISVSTLYWCIDYEPFIPRLT